MGKTIGVISIKGGVGKTSVAVNLATSIAMKHNNTLLIDANYSSPHLGFYLGILNAKNNLHTVLSGQSKIEESIYLHPSGLHVLPGSLEELSVDPMKLPPLVNSLKKHYDVIVIDSSPALNDEMYSAIASSDDLLVVSSTDYPTLSSTLRAINIAKRKKTNIRGIVLNKTHNKNFELTKEDIENTCGVSVIGTIPDDLKLSEALSEFSPVTMKFPKSKSSREYTKLAAYLLGEEVDVKSPGGFVSWLKEKFSMIKTMKGGTNENS